MLVGCTLDDWHSDNGSAFHISIYIKLYIWISFIAIISMAQCKIDIAMELRLFCIKSSIWYNNDEWYQSMIKDQFLPHPFVNSIRIHAIISTLIYFTSLVKHHPGFLIYDIDFIFYKYVMLKTATFYISKSHMWNDNFTGSCAKWFYHYVDQS